MRFQFKSSFRFLPSSWFAAAVLIMTLGSEFPTAAQSENAPVQRRLYAALPGIRNYLEFGGHGLAVFDVDHGHKFVKRIPTAGLDTDGKPMNVKGVCASVSLGRIYVSTIKTLMAIDLVTERLLWEKAYEGGCDRMAIAPDGKTIYLPSLEKDHWHVVDAASGDVLAKIVPRSGSHNTCYGLDGKEVYLAGLKSHELTIADPSVHKAVRTVGPFTDNIRPFTVNGTQTRCYVNLDKLLGFEIGDLKTGRKLHRVEVQGYAMGPVKRHGCPSHGVGLTPDEKEIWVTDGHNNRLHIFDNTVEPPRQVASILLREQPGWITFSLDGVYAWPSTGDVIDVATRKIVTGLTDENGAQVHSEKMVEIHMREGKPVRAGDQFGLGRKRSDQ